MEAGSFKGPLECSELHFLVSNPATNKWALTLRYSNETVIEGEAVDDIKDAMLGLFKASADAIEPFLTHG
jgi:hypothetical protein